MSDVALLVSDRDLPAADGVVFERLNPITGDVATRAAAASVADAQAAAAAAAAAFPAWSALGPSERRARLAAAADALERRGPDFVAAMAEETGATEAWGRFNVALAAAMMREAAALTTQVTGEIIRFRPARRHRVRAAPAGRRRARRRAVERAGDPRRAGDRRAARLRQHRSCSRVRKSVRTCIA